MPVVFMAVTSGFSQEARRLPFPHLTVNVCCVKMQGLKKLEPDERSKKMKTHKKNNSCVSSPIPQLSPRLKGIGTLSVRFPFFV